MAPNKLNSSSDLLAQGFSGILSHKMLNLVLAENVHVISASLKLYKTSIFKVVKFPSILTLENTHRD